MVGPQRVGLVRRRCVTVDDRRIVQAGESADSESSKPCIRVACDPLTIAGGHGGGPDCGPFALEVYRCVFVY